MDARGRMENILYEEREGGWVFGYFPREASVFPMKSTSTTSVYADLISQRRGEERRFGYFSEGFAARSGLYRACKRGKTLVAKKFYGF